MFKEFYDPWEVLRFSPFEFVEAIVLDFYWRGTPPHCSYHFKIESYAYFPYRTPLLHH